MAMGGKALLKKKRCFREMRHCGAHLEQRQGSPLFLVLSRVRYLSIASGWPGKALTNKSLSFSHLDRLKPQNRQIGLSLYERRDNTFWRAAFWRARNCPSSPLEKYFLYQINL